MTLDNKSILFGKDDTEAPQGLWGTRELAIFINGNTGTSGNFQGTTFKKGLLLRNWGTFQHFFLGNIQQILLGTREIFLFF